MSSAKVKCTSNAIVEHQLLGKVKLVFLHTGKVLLVFISTDLLLPVKKIIAKITLSMFAYNIVSYINHIKHESQTLGELSTDYRCSQCLYSKRVKLNYNTILTMP